MCVLRIFFRTHTRTLKVPKYIFYFVWIRGTFSCRRKCQFNLCYRIHFYSFSTSNFDFDFFFRETRDTFYFHSIFAGYFLQFSSVIASHPHSVKTPHARTFARTIPRGFAPLSHWSYRTRTCDRTFARTHTNILERTYKSLPNSILQNMFTTWFGRVQR